MLIGIEGNLGSGKTVLAVKYTKTDFDNGINIISNTPLFHIDYEEFKIEEFLSNKDEYRQKLKNSTILLDEITVYMDCRLSHSKQNILMGYLVLQSRKRSVNIYYTTQDFDLVDYRRLMKYTNILVYCQEVYTKNPDGVTESLKNWRNYSIIDLRKKRNNITEFNMDISQYFKYYDTDYIIEPIITWGKKEKVISNECRETKKESS